MRWRHEDVDFEPAGKEHHSAGGSFDTGKQIAEAVYGIDAPATFKYDFISIKGGGGKISSSSGEVIGLDDVLEIYQPELVRYLFAGTRPNAEFAISFDLDVIKIYEDYDRCERVYFGEEEVGEKRAARERRTYELSQVDGVPQQRPVQIPFRHLCNLLQIAAGDIETAIGNFTDPAKLREEDERRIRQRAECAWNWITRYAPEGFRFYLKSGDEEPVEVSETERAAIRALREELETRFEEHDEKTLAQAIYDIARDAGMEPKDFFTVMYRVLIAKEQGPRLAGFLRTIGKERALRILRAY
jgi:lysyl-tRNA synthetase class 1